MYTVRQIAIIFMLLWILLLVVHPAVDLPDTVFRSGQLLPLVLLICSSVVAVAGGEFMSTESSMLRTLATHCVSSPPSLLGKNCVQRC